MPVFSHPRSGISVQGPAIQLVRSTFGVHRDTKAGEMADELREIRAGAQTRLRFCRLPVRLQV